VRLVAVSQRVDIVHDRREYRDALDQNITRFLFKCGYISVPVPNVLQNKASGEHLVSFLEKLKPHGVLLSGGNDIGESRERDETELAMISYAEQKKLPLLGICRGMQMMAYSAGVRTVPIIGHAGTRHKISGEIFGDVNSYHDFCISECPDGYAVISISDQNTIEAIKHLQLPWEGWMWHPERELNFDKRDVDRVQSLFST